MKERSTSVEAALSRLSHLEREALKRRAAHTIARRALPGTLIYPAAAILLAFAAGLHTLDGVFLFDELGLDANAMGAAAEDKSKDGESA